MYAIPSKIFAAQLVTIVTLWVTRTINLRLIVRGASWSMYRWLHLNLIQVLYTQKQIEWITKLIILYGVSCILYGLEIPAPTTNLLCFYKRKFCHIFKDDACISKYFCWKIVFPSPPMPSRQSQEIVLILFVYPESTLFSNVSKF